MLLLYVLLVLLAFTSGLERNRWGTGNKNNLMRDILVEVKWISSRLDRMENALRSIDMGKKGLHL